MIFQGSGGGLSDLFGGFTNFVTAMLALSVASERVTETIKQFLNPLEGMGKASKAQQGAGQTGTAQQGKTSDFLGKWFAWLSSDWATQGIAILSGIIVVALSGTDPIGGLAIKTFAWLKNADWLRCVVAGILVSGGSATWNHVLDILKAAKVQKETTANKALPADQQISS
jgi:hypothetical protein